MQKLNVTVLLLLLVLLANGRMARAGGPFPRLLPPAQDLHLTLREDPHSHAPLGPSCSGEASLTLPCKAFTLTLQNASKYTIHISELRCSEPTVVFERKRPSSSSGWWPISQPGKPDCSTLDWINLRLKPGQKTKYTTRLISPRRDIDALDSLYVGSYTLRAEWTLVGCTGMHPGTDCLSPLQVVLPPGGVPGVDFQQAVIVLSNEVTVESPPLPNLGEPKFAFEVSVTSGVTPQGANAVCAGAAPTRADCTLFRYYIRNLGSQPVRNATFTCNDSNITAEYRHEGSGWADLPIKGPERKGGLVTNLPLCTRNVLIETPILSGQTIEGTFTLATLSEGYDTRILRQPGQYDFRFTFHPDACIASPDGSFCLQRPSEQPGTVSNAASIEVPEPNAPN